MWHHLQLLRLTLVAPVLGSEAMSRLLEAQRVRSTSLVRSCCIHYNPPSRPPQPLLPRQPQVQVMTNSPLNSRYLILSLQILPFFGNEKLNSVAFFFVEKKTNLPYFQLMFKRVSLKFSDK